MRQDSDRTEPSLAAEVVGWLTFAAFVLGMWLLRRTLNRPSDDG